MKPIRQIRDGILRHWPILGLCLVFFWIAGCATTPSGPVDRGDPQSISPLLVIPLQDMSRVCGTDTSVRSPLSGRVFQTGPVEKGAPEAVTRMLEDRLAATKAFNVSRPRDGGVSNRT